jgi:beta-lactamase regulating signal transducer with metallopeptidase domain
VSTGMLGGLAPAERRALLAHERAHLTNSHHLFVAAVDVLAAVNPLLRPLTSVVRYTTERWADESAADVVGDRRIVARAVGKAALAGRVQPRSAVVLAATTGPVPRRVGALLAARPGPGGIVSVTGLCAAVACVLVATSLLSSVEAMADLHHAAELAQYQSVALTRLR